MAVFVWKFFLVTVLTCVFKTTSGLSEIILDVNILCAPDISGTAVAYLSSDEPLSVTIKCKDDNSFNVSRVGTSEFFNTTVQYTGDSKQNCVFKKKLNSEVYEVELEVAHSYGIESVLDAYRLTCTYDKYKTDVNMEVGMIDSLKPRKQLETHLGHNASSSFSIEVQDVFGIPIVGAEIMYSQKIRLVITMTPAPGSSSEQGFKVLHCYAVGDDGINKYPFLRSGCGDGHIIRRDRGFVTDNFVARSPYFKTFRLYGSDTVSFQCIFNTCGRTCDGDSCVLSKIFYRRKRDSQHLTEKKKIKVSQTAKKEFLNDINSGVQNNTGSLENHAVIAKSKAFSIGLSNHGKISHISTTRTVTSERTGGLTVDQIGVIVGCSSFILMLALFAGIFVYHLRQRNKVESQYRAYRIKDLDSSTCLLYNEDT